MSCGVLPTLLFMTACVPRQSVPCTSTRLPVHREGDWDPNAPLILAWAAGDLAHDAAGLLSGVRLTDAAGDPVPFVGATRGSVVYLCPVDGLEPSSSYVWEVAVPAATASNSVAVPDYHHQGLWVFTTSERSRRTPIRGEAGCRKAALSEQTPCYADLEPDTGDTGDVDETGVTP